jgi:serine/threonine-protein kinase
MSSDQPSGDPPLTINDTVAAAGSARGPISLPVAGYEVGGRIGHGGMGEVVSAWDRRIGRDVAIKRMRGDAPSEAAIARFLREARIQARLDHPAIVPVHELGIDADGCPYFTMRRLSGVTLAQRLAERAPVKPMLRAFVDICFAIQFAHERRYVHRDLKPANIMLGEYAEVYVLDWGIARVVADKGRASTEPGDIESLDTSTRAGDILGTPGYMAPEQVQNLDVGRAADVYSLGAILFEILAGEALHPSGLPALSATLTSPQQSPAQRARGRDIAPELDAACVAALAADPAARPTARELADRVQSYLDGDRDVEHRRTLARAELERAREAISSGDPERRTGAMHDAGRALALDPESRDAARLVTQLIVEPPPVMPARLVAALGDEDRRLSTHRLGASMRALFATCSLVVLVPFMPIRDYTTLLVTIGCLVISAVGMAYARTRTPLHPWATAIVGLVLAFAFSRVIGPFVLTPVAIAAAMLTMSANEWLNARPSILYGWLLAATLGPLVAEWLGWFRTTWHMVDGGVTSISAIFTGLEPTDPLMLVIANVFMLATTTFYSVSANRRAIEARRKLFVQAWHLQHLLPASAVGP